MFACAQASGHVPAHAGQLAAYRSNMGITEKIESARLRELTKYPTDTYARFGMLLINGKFKRLEDATTHQCLNNPKVRSEDLSLYLMCLEMKASAELATGDFPSLASSILQMRGIVSQINIANNYGITGTDETIWMSDPEAIARSNLPTFVDNHSSGTIPLNIKCWQKESNYYSVIAKVNGIPTCFTIDTGSAVSSLSYATARKLGIRPTNTKFNGITQSIVALGLANKISLDRYTLNNFYFGIFPKKITGHVPNILGMNFLVHLHSVLFSHNDIYLNSSAPHGCVPTFLRFAYTGRFLGPIIIFKVRINGHKARLLFDSGLSNNMVVFSPSKFVLRLHLTTQNALNEINGSSDSVKGYSLIKLDFDKGPQIFLPALIVNRSAFAKDPGIDMDGAFSLTPETLSGLKVFLDFSSGLACIINPSNPSSNLTARGVIFSRKN